MLWFLLPTYVVLWLAGVTMHFVYKRRLRQVDPQLADRLYPGLLKKSIGSDLAATRFLLAGEFRSLDDRDFVRLSERYRALMLVWFAVFVVTMVALLVEFSV